MAGKPKRVPRLERDGRGSCRDRVLSQECLTAIRKANAEILSHALQAALRLVGPYLAESGLHFMVRGCTYYISPDAPPTSQHAAAFLSIEDSLCDIVAGGDVAEIKEAAIFIGMSAIPILHSNTVGTDLPEAIATYLRDTATRRRGGRATTKWTAEVDRLARELFTEAKRGKKVSNEAGIKRTRAMLLERGHEFGKTLLREKLVGQDKRSHAPFTHSGTLREARIVVETDGVHAGPGQ